jgi:hypothetical protein
MDNDNKKDMRPEGGVLLEAQMMAGVAFAQHLAIRASEAGYTGTLDMVPSKGINYYNIKLEEKNVTTPHA